MALFYARRRAPALGNIFEDVAGGFVDVVTFIPKTVSGEAAKLGAAGIGAVKDVGEWGIGAVKDAGAWGIGLVKDVGTMIAQGIAPQQQQPTMLPEPEPSISPLPIVLGAVAAGGLLLLALGRKQQPS